MTGTDSGPPGLWGALRSTGLQPLAPQLACHGVRSLTDIASRFNELVAAGFLPGQLQRLCEQPMGSSLDSAAAPRRDFPAVRDGAHASLQLALAAALPDRQADSLRALSDDLLAPSTRPSVESRLRTWQAICEAWGQPSFPLTIDNVRRASASFKAGRYRSAKQYFAIVSTYQQRELGLPVDPMVRQAMKDHIRSTERGLGPSQLKEAFMMPMIGPLVQLHDRDPFAATTVAHAVDVIILGVWWMLREVELAAARAQHLQVYNNTVTLTLPFSKTDSGGHMVSRSLECACSDAVHAFCPFHAAIRHRTRLARRFGREPTTEPLLPDSDGEVFDKAGTIEVIRSVLTAAGIQLTRTTEDGREVQRFHGHVLRVTGAQFCTAAGVSPELIQTHGRWKSLAVRRYTQDASLATTPSMASRVLGGVQPATPSFSPATPVPARDGLTPSGNGDASRSAPAAKRSRCADRPRPGPAVQDLREEVQTLAASLQQLKTAVLRPESDPLVVWNRSKIAHKIGVNEQTNVPTSWRTTCGRPYGLGLFHRIPALEGDFVPCKKCFQLSSDPDSVSEESSSLGDDSSDEDDSA